MDKNELLGKINAAFKDITKVSDLGYSVLQPAFFNKYVLAATRDQTILSDARLIQMNSNVQNIDRVGFEGRILAPAVEDTEGDESTPAFGQEQLTSKEFMATVGITDKALRRTVEPGESFANTLVSMLGSQAGEDWEALAVGGDTTKYNGGADDALLHSQNGWIQKATNKIYGTGASKDFDKDKVDVTDLLSLMIKKYPRNYLKTRQQLRFYLNSEMHDSYVDEVGERPTVAGDEAIANNYARPYKGIQVVEAPVLNDSKIAGTTYGWGDVAMLQDVRNMVYGIFHQVTIEPDRIPKKRRTDYVLTMETDQGYENPGVNCVALLDQTKP